MMVKHCIKIPRDVSLLKQDDVKTLGMVMLKCPASLYQRVKALCVVRGHSKSITLLIQERSNTSSICMFVPSQPARSS